MEADKFENHIRAKLQEREINPSSLGWERISEALNRDTASRKPGYLWIGIAASILVLVAIGMFYFNDGNEQLNDGMQVVDMNKDDRSVDEQENKALPMMQEEVVVRSELKIEAPLNRNANIKGSERSIVEVPQSLTQDKIVGVAVLEGTEAQKNTKDFKLPEQIINEKVAELVAQVNVLEQYDTVTDAEVDSLLKHAQEEIIRDKIFKTNTSVDAVALLTAVEEEIDQSFRDQIFNSLKAGFVKVRTAVADRNN